MNRVSRWLVVLTLIAGVSPARADLGVPLTIKLNNLTGPAVAGQSVTFGVQLASSQAITLRNLSLTGGTATGGGPRPAGLPDSVVLAPGRESGHQATIDMSGIHANVATHLLEVHRVDVTSDALEFGQPVFKAQVAHATAFEALRFEADKAVSGWAVLRA